jgi:hypothetical protein
VALRMLLMDGSITTYGPEVHHFKSDSEEGEDADQD